jgi:hypothetical protein
MAECRPKPDRRPRQRAAKLVYLMILRELARCPRFTTAEIANKLELTYGGAWQLITSISGADGVPIWGPDEDNGTWGILLDPALLERQEIFASS